MAGGGSVPDDRACGNGVLLNQNVKAKYRVNAGSDAGDHYKIKDRFPLLHRR